MAKVQNLHFLLKKVQSKTFTLFYGLSFMGHLYKKTAGVLDNYPNPVVWSTETTLSDSPRPKLLLKPPIGFQNKATYFGLCQNFSECNMLREACMVCFFPSRVLHL